MRLKLIFRLSILIIFFGINFVETSNAQDTISSPNPNGPTKVYVSIVINNVSDVNSATERMNADLFIVVKWNDPRLVHGGKGRVARRVDDIWDPSLTIINRMSTNKTLPDIPTVLHDGTVIYIQRLSGEFSQDFELKDFPFDTQTFKINLIAYGFSEGEVEFVPDTEIQSGLSGSFTLPDWKILDWKLENTVYSLFKGTENTPSITFSFRAKRQSGYYLLVFLIPLVLIIMMSWMVFWLDPSASSVQISLATTSMLTLIAYRFIMVGSLPKISYLTRIDFFVIGASFLIFLTLIEAVTVSGLVIKGKQDLARKLDRHCRWIFPIAYVIVCLIAFVW